MIEYNIYLIILVQQQNLSLKSDKEKMFQINQRQTQTKSVILSNTKTSKLALCFNQETQPPNVEILSIKRKQNSKDTCKEQSQDIFTHESKGRQLSSELQIGNKSVILKQPDQIYDVLNLSYHLNDKDFPNHLFFPSETHHQHIYPSQDQDFINIQANSDLIQMTPDASEKTNINSQTSIEVKVKKQSKQNIIKVLGKQLLAWIWKNRQLLEKKIKHLKIYSKDKWTHFIEFIKNQKTKNNITRKQLFQGWHSQSEISKIFRTISGEFFRKHIISSIYQSNVLNREFHLSYKGNFLKGVSVRNFFQ